MVAMFKGGGLTKEKLSKKLLCFGADGMSVFKGRGGVGGTRITKQIKDSWVLSLMGVHCVAHWTNLAIQSLGDLTLIAHIEVFMMNTYGYFNHLNVEFQKLAQTLDTKGNKILKNVKTRWMSMLKSLKKIMAKYYPLLPMMHADFNSNQVAKVQLILF